MFASVTAVHRPRYLNAEIHQRWIAVEHHRLDSIEAWPEGPRKQAAITAICSTLTSLSRLSTVGQLVQ